MARARNIKPSLFKNEVLGVADPLLTILFESLWCLADKAGRLEDRPLRIKAETFPYRDGIDINGYLTELYTLGFIDRYKAVCNGKEIDIIEVINFTKHQTPHSTEKASELPCKPIDKPITLNNASAAVNGHINVLITDSLNTDSLIPDVGAEKSAPKANGKSLPKDWVLPRAWGEWALLERSDFNVEIIRKEAEKFKDHWLANANQAKAKKSDWEAAWRNWIRNSAVKKSTREESRTIAAKSVFTPKLMGEIAARANIEKVVEADYAKLE